MVSRNMDPDKCDLHLGFDGGQGSLKLVLSITERKVEENHGRAKYSEVKYYLWMSHIQNLYLF